MLRVHGGKPKYYHALIGGNFRIDELQAAVLNVKLQAPGCVERRAASATRPSTTPPSRGPSSATRSRTPHAEPGGRHIYNQYVIRVRDRDALRQHLAGAGVGTEIYYPVPLHLQQCFAYLGGRAGDFPLSEQAAAQTLALPIFPELAQAQLQYVVDSIAAYFRA